MLTRTIPYTIQACGRSDVGLVRDNNEDAWKVELQNNVFILADGMGGHSAGEIAAHTAVEHYTDLVKEKLSIETKADLMQAAKIMRELIREVNHAVHRMGRSDSDLRGMGTTLVVSYFHQEGMIYGHVGDSRLYLMRRKKLRQLTEDHSLVQELIELGELSEKRARDYSHRNIITKAIGTEPYVDPSVHQVEVKSGDLILMCSDGLTDLLTDEEIEAIVASSQTIEKKAETLIQEAKRRGGHDNITVILMKIQAAHEKADLPRP